jgi:hypothetical protein
LALFQQPPDLNWLNMTEGEKVIWKIADPLRADSIFFPHVPDFMQYALSISSSGIELQNLPPELIQLCSIETASTQEDSPYLASVSVLAQVIKIQCNGHNLATFMCFLGRMYSDYKRLLEQKDPCALLLLAYWHAKMCEYKPWWIWPRAILECQAIYIYLKLYRGDKSNIMRLIQYPKMACDLIER